MTWSHGWAALHLDMPPVVPRTEYSAEFHWDLVKAVTGIECSPHHPTEQRLAAMAAFAEAWDYDIFWSTLVDANVFGDKRTRMGHAEYQKEGADFSTEVSKLFEEPEDALTFEPFELYGAVDVAKAREDFENDYRWKSNLFSNAVNMTGVYVTCVSGMIDIFGWETLLEALGIDPDGFGAVVERYGEWMQGYYNALAESSVPIVGVHDDMVWSSGPFARPEWYRRYVFPTLKKYLDPLREAGKKIVYCCDGNFTPFLQDLVDAGVSGFVLEPHTDMAAIAERYGKTHFFIGNADTRILLRGTREQIRAEVKRCMDIGKSCPGFILAVGNHIPPNTPVENALYYNEVYEELSRR
ncbi:MAG: hypothetical protein PWP23_632 [Candidatus Sumerlaeota bacterium]|nr:hypothetical protein [Candidatus Sumerlaeota bacterium]